VEGVEVWGGDHSRVGFLAYVLGDPGAAYSAWARYQAAMAGTHKTDASKFMSTEFLAFEKRVRGLALNAPETALAPLPTLDVLGTLGTREAVLAGHLSIADIRNPEHGRGFPANTSGRQVSELALLLVVPTTPGRAIGWVGPKQFAHEMSTLVFAMAFGMRINFIREEGVWRIDMLPALRASAEEHDAIGATGSPAVPWPSRKRSFNALFAHADPVKQNALWTPLNTLQPAQPAG